MHPTHADIDGVQHHADRFVHQSPQAKLGRHQVGLVPIRFPDNLQETIDMLPSADGSDSILFIVWGLECSSRP